MQLLEITLAFIFLFASEMKVRDKAYKLLRFIYVMYFFLYLPFTIYYFFHFTADAPFWRIVYIGAMRVTGLFCVTVFIIAKPERPVEKIDLSEYELVSYTSAGHRFLHYLLDVLFLFPVMLALMRADSYS